VHTWPVPGLVNTNQLEAAAGLVSAYLARAWACKYKSAGGSCWACECIPIPLLNPDVLVASPRAFSITTGGIFHYSGLKPGPTPVLVHHRCC
jgi:hypothetical protein